MPAECDRSQIVGAWWIGTSAGNLVNLRSLKDEDIDFESIINALSMQCRYGGHVKWHYSIAQHLCYVSDCMADCTGFSVRAAMAGLIHDFPEGLLQDLVRGIKVGILNETPVYHEIDSEIQSRINRLVGLEDYDSFHELVKEWDNRVLKSEVYAIGTPCEEWKAMLDSVEFAPIKVRQWTPEFARHELSRRFYHYKSILKGIVNESGPESERHHRVD